jgi:hypothetical protein
MPGVQEIQSTIHYLRAANDIYTTTEIMPLHANLTTGEQKMVFKSTTQRKIVVATNVAEVGRGKQCVPIRQLTVGARLRSPYQTLSSSSTPERSKKFHTIPRRGCLHSLKHGLAKQQGDSAEAALVVLSRAGASKCIPNTKKNHGQILQSQKCSAFL